MPGIGDPRFERAVILMCAHSADHAVGLMVNRPFDHLTVPDLLQRLETPVSKDITPDPVLYGGPVDEEHGFVLHTDDHRSGEASVDICAGVRLTATREILVALGDPAAAPRRALLALGYAGWGAGQLEGELQQSVWLTCDPDEDLLFGRDHDAKWAKALGKIGVSPGMLSATGGRA